MELGSFRLVPASVNDAYTILDDVREEDVAEWDASGCHDFFASLRGSIEHAVEVFSVVDARSRAHVIFGVSAAPGRTSVPAIVWMVATNTAAKRWLEFAPSLTTWAHASFFTRWPALICWADSRNEVHLKWLRWLGFVQTGGMSTGGVLFHEMRRG